MNSLTDILSLFGLETEPTVQPFGTGLINHTFKLSCNGKEYILQQINSNVFKSPERIAYNLSLIQAYLNQNFPEYLFIGPLPSIKNEFLVLTGDINYYRLFPFVSGSETINFVSNPKEAFEAAKQFGKFSKVLKDFEWTSLRYTLADFHNLDLRFKQFTASVASADPDKALLAATEVNAAYDHSHLVKTYNNIILHKEIPLRVIHHDTKISNVLFDSESNGLCVIDLDTVMPGYFFSDVGDMMRTYLSAANEEETDTSKVSIREEIFMAICEGYLSEMGDILTTREMHYFILAGELMIYMQAIRFLTDFLNNDIYYGSKYPGHNLTRAKNQFKLLEEYISHKKRFTEIIAALTNNKIAINV